jgi:hypothetical protein
MRCLPATLLAICAWLLLLGLVWLCLEVSRTP